MKKIIATPFFYVRKFDFSVKKAQVVDRDFAALWIDVGRYNIQIPFLRKRVS
jgi:hypothetical protein